MALRVKRESQVRNVLLFQLFQHSLNRLLCLPCMHFALPPHSLHPSLRLSCSHVALPPHSLHPSPRLSCSHIALPPHSLNPQPPFSFLLVLTACQFGGGIKPLASSPQLKGTGRLPGSITNTHNTASTCVCSCHRHAHTTQGPTLAQLKVCA